MQGWSLTGIVLMQSGLPMTLTDPNGGTVYGRAATSTVTHVPGRDLCVAGDTRGSVSARLDNWINPSAICSPVVWARTARRAMATRARAF